jgi:hypothetical protein
MSILGLVLVLVIVGVVMYYVPMDARLKTIIVVVLALVVGAWLLDYFGLWSSLRGSGAHRLR